MNRWRYLFLLQAAGLCALPVLATCTEGPSRDARPGAGAPPDNPAAAAADPGQRGAARGAKGAPPDGGTAPFTLCEGTFALCTTAPCKPMIGADGGPMKNDAGQDLLACACSVQQGYSAGAMPDSGPPCAEVSAEPPRPGQRVASRYSPIKSMAVCSSYANMPWAWCLDMPCTVDVADAGPDAGSLMATCQCTQTTTSEDWIVVTDTYSDSTCPSNEYVSSATVGDVMAVTGFLQGSPQLPALPITIVGVGVGKQ